MTFRIFSQLLRRDLVVYRKEYGGKLFDMMITFGMWVIVFGYFTPLMGMQATYGVFIMVGSITSMGIFDIIGQAGSLIMDIKGDRTISYLLLLPIRSWLIFSYFAISWAIKSALLAIPLYIAGKLIFWNQFDLSLVSWHQLVMGFLVCNLFFGTFALWIVSIFHRVSDVGRLYFRFLNPLFILGCYFFTWEAATTLSPAIGYLCLIDPISYVMEGMRAAILGPSGYLPFWVSFAALCAFIALLGTHACRRLRKQLDCL
ncbi:MAG: hypothetical protein JSR80_06335 [Verrucomicrobia bacterium]|nr:hypothetical protein [Verrucomicrobiota bacterium]